MVPLLTAYLNKLDCYLWYLSERLVVLAFFSNFVPIDDKKAMAKSFQNARIAVASFLCNKCRFYRNTTLANLIDLDSWTLII